RAAQQLRARFAFQQLEPLADVRARHAELARGGAKTARFDDLDEQADQVQVHGSIVLVITWQSVRIALTRSLIAYKLALAQCDAGRKGIIASNCATPACSLRLLAPSAAWTDRPEKTDMHNVASAAASASGTSSPCSTAFFKRFSTVRATF